MNRRCANHSPLLLLLLGALLAPLSRASADRARDADSLYSRALRELDRRTIDHRRTAIAQLEQATLLEPGNAEYQLVLARTYFEAGFLKRARTRFERVVSLAPSDPDSRFGLGQVWRRDWLKYLDPTSLDRAVENFSVATRLDPSRADSWIMLSPLLIEQRNLPAAAAAAERALESAPERGEALLAAASTSYRLGSVERAESLFVRAIPRLKPMVRARFEDISPLASEQDTMVLHHLPPREQVEFVRRFWKEHDPDPTTRLNEVQLEYWARATQAYFLYFDLRRREWDERGEVYVRYGPPDSAAYNPIGSPNMGYSGSYGTFRTSNGIPCNSLVWDYRDLGMTVTLQDRILSEYYLLPTDMEEDLDPVPDPDSLARRGDALATRGGRGVFRTLPPGARALPVAGEIARFEGERGPRLLTQLEVSGSPGDSLWAECVVLDSTENEVMRQRTTLTPSPCDPANYRVGDFDAGIAPGLYRVGVSVHGQAGGRGIFLTDVEIPPASGALTLSDVVISCGAPDVTPGAIRLAANPGARVGAAGPLTAYFEIYHLRPDGSGQSRFEYVYTVRSAEQDRRIWIQRLLQPREKVPSLSASREEQNLGSLRRQFVSVPVQSLPAGRYLLEIRVRDLIAGTEKRREAEFHREPLSAAGPGPTRGAAPR